VPLDERIAEFDKHRYISLTTFRRDGRAVATPVWFALYGPRIIVWTGAASGKAKRIRANGRATIAPCDARGRAKGDAMPATGRILSSSDDASARALLTHRYRLLKPLVDTWTAATHFVRRKRRPTEIFIELTLSDDGDAATGDR
jgi:PPOX class probable F420-dependent enzyme